MDQVPQPPDLTRGELGHLAGESSGDAAKMGLHRDHLLRPVLEHLACREQLPATLGIPDCRGLRLLSRQLRALLDEIEAAIFGARSAAAQVADICKSALIDVQSAPTLGRRENSDFDQVANAPRTQIQVFSDFRLSCRASTPTLPTSLPCY